MECIGAPKLDRLSNTLEAFNEQIDTLIDDGARIMARIRDDIALKLAASSVFKNVKEHTSHTARLTHDKAMRRLLKDDTQVYEQFVENRRSGGSLETRCLR